MEKISQLVTGLNSYHGRDACLKFICYMSLFINGLIIIINNEDYFHAANAFKILSRQSSNCRIVLRFFEDLPAIYNLFTYLSLNDKVWI